MPRDDFSDTTKQKLAERVSWKCSFPECGQNTVGPNSLDINKRINNGIAAHITAASPTGPRYDPSLTSEQRKNIKNGIWMCRNHGNLIDADESNYTVETLNSWKSEAEKRAYNNLQQTSVESPSYSNVIRNKNLYSSFKDANFYSLYWDEINCKYILIGMNPINIAISDNSTDVSFNNSNTWRNVFDISNSKYLTRIQLDFWSLFESIVLLYDELETIYDFTLSFSDGKYISTTTSTENACYGGEYTLKDGFIFTDEDVRVSPSEEKIFYKILDLCSNYRASVVP